MTRPSVLNVALCSAGWAGKQPKYTINSTPRNPGVRLREGRGWAMVCETHLTVFGRVDSHVPIQSPAAALAPDPRSQRAPDLFARSVARDGRAPVPRRN